MMRMVVGEEAVGIDRRLGDARRIVQRRERDAPALALRAGLRGVDEDPEHPRLERRPALEAVERAEHAQPRLLHDLLGDRASRSEDARDPEQAGVPLAHDRGEGRLVPRPERGDQLVVGERHSGERTTVTASKPAAAGAQGESIGHARRRGDAGRKPQTSVTDSAHGTLTLLVCKPIRRTNRMGAETSR